jgi:hypothetical protein
MKRLSLDYLSVLPDTRMLPTTWKPNSWTYNFVDFSGHNLESAQTWVFRIQCLHYSTNQRGVKSIAEVTVNSKEEKLLRLLSQLRPRIRPLVSWRTVSQAPATTFTFISVFLSGQTSICASLHVSKVVPLTKKRWSSYLILGLSLHWWKYFFVTSVSPC